MKKILLLFVSALMLVACGDEIPENSDHKHIRSGRTILAYMVANNDLDTNIMDNIVDMYRGLSNQNDTCTLIVFYKPNIGYNSDSLLVSVNSNITAPSIIKFETNGRGRINGKPALLGADLTKKNMMAQAQILKEYPMDMNSLDPNNMEKILRFMVQDTRTKHYGLIFGSHASSWLPAKTRRAFGLDGMKIKYQINIPEMVQALQGVFSTDNLDFILWDACMMGTVEVVHELQYITKYMIASVMESPAKGFPYSEIFKYLYNDYINFDRVCKESIFFFEESGWGTVAAFDCRQIGQLEMFVRNNRSLFDPAKLEYGKSLIQQYGVNRSKTKYFSFDVMDTFRYLTNNSVPDDLKRIMGQLVLAKECLDGYQYNFEGLIIDKEKFSGTGMYIPVLHINSQWDEFYKKLSWCKAVGWDEMMD